MWAFLDREVDVADGYSVLDFVVEDRLEGAYDLGLCVSFVSSLCFSGEADNVPPRLRCRTRWPLEVPLQLSDVLVRSNTTSYQGGLKRSMMRVVDVGVPVGVELDLGKLIAAIARPISSFSSTSSQTSTIDTHRD